MLFQGVSAAPLTRAGRHVRRPMTTEIGFVYGLIAIAAVLMASNRVRYDIVALLVVLALMLSGVLTVGEAIWRGSAAPSNA